MFDDLKFHNWARACLLSLTGGERVGPTAVPYGFHRYISNTVQIGGTPFKAHQPIDDLYIYISEDGGKESIDE